MNSSYSDWVEQRTQPESVRPRFPISFSERRLVLMVCDLLGLNLSLFVVVLALFKPEPPILVWFWRHPAWFLLLSILWLLAAPLWDGYDLMRAASPYGATWNGSAAALLVGGSYWLIPFLSPPLPPQRVYMLALPLLSALWVGLWRLLYATLFTQPAFQQTALVIGAGCSGQALVQAVRERNPDSDRSRGAGYHIVGFIDDAEEKQGCQVAGLPVLGTRRDLVALHRQHRPQELVLAITDMREVHPELFQALLDCRERGAHVTLMASVYERMTGRVPVEHAGHNLQVIMPVAPSPGYHLYIALKRLVDIGGALVGCLFLMLLIPPLWLVNYLTDAGDLFYRQKRVGQGGGTFHVIKFRSMVMDAEKETGAVWAGKNDSRVTFTGRLLRKTRLDEVPQCWNVLKGEMSLIGPRPERPVFVQQLQTLIPFYRARHAVKPGITGWAQVKYRYGASAEDALIKLQYDLYYIKHQGMRLDIAILLKTVQVMLGLQGR